MPRTVAWIQHTAQTHSHLSSTRFVIPNYPALCKGRIKKVTGDAEEVILESVEGRLSTGKVASIAAYNGF